MHLLYKNIIYLIYRQLPLYAAVQLSSTAKKYHYIWKYYSSELCCRAHVGAKIMSHIIINPDHLKYTTVDISWFNMGCQYNSPVAAALVNMSAEPLSMLKTAVKYPDQNIIKTLIVRCSNSGITITSSVFKSAVKASQYDNVKLLIQIAPNIISRDAIKIAIKNNDDNMLQIIGHVNPNYGLLVACKYNRQKIIDTIVELGANNFKEAYTIAVHNQHFEIINCLEKLL